MSVSHRIFYTVGATNIDYVVLTYSYHKFIHYFLIIQRFERKNLRKIIICKLFTHFCIKIPINYA
jgi:hypothetical protein